MGFNIFDPLNLFGGNDPLSRLFGTGPDKFEKKLPMIDTKKPDVPDIADALLETKRIQAEEAKDARRRRKGRASQVLTGSQGAGLPTTAGKALLGD